MQDESLQDVVVAFDLDNTLTNPTGEAYNRSVREFLARSELRLDPDEGFKTFEEVRSHGIVLERLGLGNPIHERDHPDGMALLCLMGCKNPAVLRKLNVHAEDQPAYDIVLRRLRELHRGSRTGAHEQRLEAEITLRTAVRHRPEVRRLSDEIKRVALDPFVARLAKTYRDIALAQPVPDHRPLIEGLISKGATPVVISEGRTAIQLEKLHRLGLLEMLEGQVLVTEDAAKPPGIDELDEAISGRMDAHGGGASVSDDDELALLWHFHCLIDSWNDKTPWFFSRCLHAIQHARAVGWALPTRNGADAGRILPGYVFRSPKCRTEAPLLDKEGFGEVLAHCPPPSFPPCQGGMPNADSPATSSHNPIFLPVQRWRDRPLRFVMVGDRYDKDVRPLMDLLGSNVGLKIRLQAGKYAHLHPADELPPDQLPDRTFTDWDSLSAFLTHDLRIDDIEPITAPPDIVPRDGIRSDFIERGLDCPIAAVRLVAEAVANMIA